MGYSPCARRELDTTERLSTASFLRTNPLIPPRAVQLSRVFTVCAHLSDGWVLKILFQINLTESKYPQPFRYAPLVSKIYTVIFFRHFGNKPVSKMHRMSDNHTLS